MLVWTLVVGFAVGGEARSIAGYRRVYEAATDHSIYPSSFYDRFTEELATLLRDLLDHAVEEQSRPSRVRRVRRGARRRVRISAGTLGGDLPIARPAIPSGDRRWLRISSTKPRRDFVSRSQAAIAVTTYSA